MEDASDDLRVEETGPVFAIGAESDVVEHQAQQLGPIDEHLIGPVGLGEIAGEFPASEEWPMKTLTLADPPTKHLGILDLGIGAVGFVVAEDTPRPRSVGSRRQQGRGVDPIGDVLEDQAVALGPILALRAVSSGRVDQIRDDARGFLDPTLDLPCRDLPLDLIPSHTDEPVGLDTGLARKSDREFGLEHGNFEDMPPHLRLE
jgi:hypothetical protein